MPALGLLETDEDADGDVEAEDDTDEEADGDVDAEDEADDPLIAAYDRPLPLLYRLVLSPELSTRFQNPTWSIRPLNGAARVLTSPISNRNVPAGLADVPIAVVLAVPALTAIPAWLLTESCQAWMQYQVAVEGDPRLSASTVMATGVAFHTVSRNRSTLLL